MAYGTRAGFEQLRIVAFGAVTNSYTALGTPFTGHVRIMCITNSTDKDMLISFDGTTDNLRLFTGSFKLLDFTANKVQDDGLFFPVGTQVYVKYTSAPVSGNVWVEALNSVAGGV